MENKIEVKRENIVFGEIQLGTVGRSQVKVCGG